MESVLISIQPKWCELIASGRKTIEVRKTRPKIETPFRCYIYCTKGKSSLISVQKDGDVDYFGEIYHGKTLFIKAPQILWNKKCENISGKVIGEFVCDRVRLCIPFGLKGHLLSQEVYREMCLTKEQLDKYGGLKTLYGWHISDLKIYDKPRELGEFYTICNKYGDDYCGDCPYLAVEQCSFPCDDCVDTWCSVDNIKPITRPPQSWCYVEELQ